MFQTICDLIPNDPDLTVRSRRLDILTRVLDGTLYDVLPYEFHDERSPSGEYVPLRRRRPSVRYALSRVVVEDSVALLFSEGHFPAIQSSDSQVRDAMAAVVRDCRLNQVMVEAATRGSVGSSAILLRVLRGRAFLDVLDTACLTPVWEAEVPDVLSCLTERYKAPGADLIAAGFDVADASMTYWFERRWDREWETWFVPRAVGTEGSATRDEGRSVRHGLGFVPIVWIKNLPGGVAPDGACTFRAAVETSIEIDYQLSQAGRGLKYSSDPTLLIKEPAGIEGELVRGAANALVVSEKGDARLLEINGTAAGAVLDYVRTLRELALEGVHGNRAEASRMRAPMSGRALELMNQGLVWLADQLRVSYGEGGLLAVLRMILRAGKVYPLFVGGSQLGLLDAEASLSLVWPSWYPATSEDRARDASTVLSLVKAGQMSRAAAVRVLSADWGLDAAAELAVLNEGVRS